MMSTSAAGCVLTDQRDLLIRALSQSGVPALRQVSIDEREDSVILSGKLPSYYLKQLAQEAVFPHLGHRVLENRITVKPH